MQKISEKMLEDVVFEVGDMSLNFDQISEQARKNSDYVFLLVTYVYTQMHMKRNFPLENPSVELVTEPTNFGASRLDVIANTIELDLHNDIRTLVNIKGIETKPIFFSVKSLMELGKRFGLNLYLFNDSEKIISSLGNNSFVKKS